MIGYVGTGASFFDCMRYCLEDKKELSEEKKRELSEKDHLQHKDRAEVLYYHKCCGDKKELARDFNEVARLSKRVEKPVFHFSLRLAPGEALSKDKWMEIGEVCAKAFGVSENQYLCVLHKDTREQHIHLVANRVGFNGKVASDSNSYRRMAQLCRNLEKQYQLKEVLSPRAFLSKEERNLPRHDLRKEQLLNNIRQTLKEANNYREFENGMKNRGYAIVKGRGISFIDDKKVKTKGSEVGFSLSRIEKVLSLKNELAVKKAAQQVYQIAQRQQLQKPAGSTGIPRSGRNEKERENPAYGQYDKGIAFLEKAIWELLKYTPTNDYVPYEFTEAGYEQRKRKEKAQSLHR